MSALCIIIFGVSINEYIMTMLIHVIVITTSSTTTTCNMFIILLAIRSLKDSGLQL